MRKRETLAQRNARLLKERKDRRRLAAHRLDLAEEEVGKGIMRPGRNAADPEQILGEAARRLRKKGTPYAKDLALRCEDLADWPRDARDDWDEEERDEEDEDREEDERGE